MECGRECDSALRRRRKPRVGRRPRSPVCCAQGSVLRACVLQMTDARADAARYGHSARPPIFPPPLPSDLVTAPAPA